MEKPISMLGLSLDQPVAALFVMSPTPSGKWASPYRSISGVDAWDKERDATLYNGPHPVVAHPPCRMFSKLKAFAKGVSGERALFAFAVAAVRRWGGVLEHPEGSSGWDLCRLPRHGEAADAFGGYTICVDQFCWGHSCRKRTWLYIVGCPINALPPMPTRAGEPTRMVSGDRNVSGLPGIGKFACTPRPTSRSGWWRLHAAPDTVNIWKNQKQSTCIWTCPP